MHDQRDFPELSAAALRVLREDQPSVRELAAAYQRFARKPQRRSAGLLVSRWLLAGLVMGLGVAFGAQAVVRRLQPTSVAERPEPVAAPSAARKAAVRSAPVPSPQDTPELPAQPLAPPSELKPPRAASFASPKAVTVGVDERPPADSAVWAKAAEGLRNNDFAETQSALATLENASSATDREAARLIRAQLMLHQGDASGARTLLHDLASNAQSAQVRSKARSLLGQSSVKSNSALNVAPSGT
jgi:hypothetical protein